MVACDNFGQPTRSGNLAVSNTTEISIKQLYIKLILTTFRFKRGVTSSIS